MSYQNGYNGYSGPVFNGGAGFGMQNMGMNMGYGGGVGGGGGGGGGGGRGYGGRGGRGRGYGGGGGGRDGRDGRDRRDHRDRDRDGRGPPPESSYNRMKKMIIRFAEEEDFHPIEDPPRLARALKRQWREGSKGVFEGFRVGVSQEPHKHPHFVSLLTHLSFIDNRTDGNDEDHHTGEKRKAESGEPEYGREVLEDLSQAFRTWVEGREWLSMRCCIQFFSLLVPARLVSPSTLLEVYRSLLTVLDEFGGGGNRAERVIRALGEGLMRSAKALNEDHTAELETIMGQLEHAINSRSVNTDLIDPIAPILAEGEEKETFRDTLGELATVLEDLRSRAYEPPDCLPRYWEEIQLPEGCSRSPLFDLAAASIPPEMYEAGEPSMEDGEGRTGGLVLFAEDVVHPSTTLDGWTLRSLILDIVTLFEVNRKECARILLSLRQFVTRQTFKPLNPPSEADQSFSTRSLESLIVQTILQTMTALPESPFPLLYYGSVLTELCKLSPNTVAPPVGRAVRRVFSLLGAEGLEVEVARRISEWFATHLSNFGFQWMWKEWIPELELPAAHPRRAFMRRVVELEVRLAYHDRILQTLPEPMTVEGAGVISHDPPDPVWQYEQPENPMHSEASTLLEMYRQKASPQDVRDHLGSITSASPESIRIMAAETLLHLGSRSFSHFLNATERYLDTLRYLTPDQSARRTLLEAVASFWRRSSQMRLITVDKYLQYGILEGLDVVEWVFSREAGGGGGESGEGGDGWTDGEKWEILRMCLEKHVGRVMAIKRRVRMVDKEDEAARAKRAAEKLDRGEGVGENEDVEPEAKLERSKEARDAQTSLDIQSDRLEKVLLAVMRHFVSDLLPWTSSSEGGQGLKGVLMLLEGGESGWWGVRSRWGWYREFVRRYETHLLPLSPAINEKIFGHLDGGNDAIEKRAEEMVRDIWTTISGLSSNSEQI
ncbi:MIF4G like-domain-containing protein [Kockovaella imperatae]|uniref:MIF4G like-domain-containing protein n=1 Tax=Kockovaella imperatae TaxID=4999 RepID=A0A1Y1UNP5_9TREE|nr:MIF4G like-domain-containing protein [Kockovaella imperatae]ORX39663.1 MIF4G like-domain-containing protein [Kockovaella imperatae]